MSCGCNRCYMDLNIRGVPEEVMREAKAGAARMGITLREFVIEQLRAMRPILEAHEEGKRNFSKFWNGENQVARSTEGEEAERTSGGGSQVVRRESQKKVPRVTLDAIGVTSGGVGK